MVIELKIMKLYCLSGSPNKPCYALTFKGTTMMLDCGLDLSPLQHYLPLPQVKSQKFDNLQNWQLPGIQPERINHVLKDSGGRPFIDAIPEFSIPSVGLLDLSEVDAILISSALTMLALPFITEYTNFSGKVYATEPTLQIARQYMEELVHHLSYNPKRSSADVLKGSEIKNSLPQPLKDSISTSWRQCYSMHDVNASLSKVTSVGFNEKLEIFGALQCIPCSSGYYIGSCNWVIQSDYEKIVYLSSSSTLTTHPKPMDQPPLKNADILILTAMTNVPTNNPDAMIRDFCINAAMTLKGGGNVLVPCYPSGVTFDLFECLSAHMDTCGLLHIPMYFISPVAETSLAYSNIFAEWLSIGKQNKVYLPEPPFPHAELVKSSRLRPFASLNDGISNEFKSPCVVFTGHPSLRFGEAVHFIELWGKSSNNMIIFTEPEFPYLEALAPYQPLAMTLAYCPIDTGLNFSQANRLIRDLKPITIVTPEEYISPPGRHPNRTDLVLDVEPAPITFKRNSILNLPIKRSYEKLEIDHSIAQSLVPIEVRPGVAVATATGTLVAKDGKYSLLPIKKEVSSRKRKGDPILDPTKKSYIWGTVEIDQLKDGLWKRGIVDIKVEEREPGSYLVDLPSEESLIQVDEGSTHVICNEEKIRVKIRDALTECLNKL